MILSKKFLGGFSSGAIISCLITNKYLNYQQTNNSFNSDNYWDKFSKDIYDYLNI